MEWYWAWIAFVIVAVALPIAYGRRRRISPVGGPEPASREIGGEAPHDDSRPRPHIDVWGRLGSFIWIALAIGIIWLFLGLLGYSAPPPPERVEPPERTTGAP